MNRFEKMYYSIITESVTLTDGQSKLVYNSNTGKFDSNGNVKIVEQDIIDGHFPFPLGVIKGNFDCSGLSGLLTFENGPTEVTKDVKCCNCNQLHSLEGAPNSIGGSFDCSGCYNLMSMQGVTINVGKNFIMKGCESIRTLDGVPQMVKGDFDCSECLQIVSLQGGPAEVKGNFICSDCCSLKTIDGAPNNVGKDFICSGCDKLTSLEARPHIGGNLKM